MEHNKICQICNELFEDTSMRIEFDCSHTICFKCYPYIALNLLSHSNFSLDCRLLDSFKKRYSCPCCKKGKALEKSSKIHESFLKMRPNFDKTKNILCYLCKENNATKICNVCQVHYEGILCDEFAIASHSFQKKREHKLFSIDIEGIKNYCCFSKKNNEFKFYCEDCSIFVCSNCCEKSHRRHSPNKNEEILCQIENIHKDLLEKTMKSLRESFKYSKNNFFAKFKNYNCRKRKAFSEENREIDSKTNKFAQND